MLKKFLYPLVVLALVVLMIPQKTSAEVLAWQPVVNSTLSGTQAPGFGDENNDFITSMATFNGNLYAATYNHGQGTEIWQTNNGTTWQQANTDGFGTHTTSAAVLAVFQNQLYTARSNMTVAGIDIYRRAANDAPDTLANTIAGATIAVTMIPYGNALYIGATNAGNAAAVYASTDGSTWNQINPDNFGDPNNVIIQSMAVFNNLLYVGVANDTTGAEIWRYDGTNWIQDNPIDGFDGADNISVGALAAFNGQLYASTSNVAGAEVWRTTGNGTWSKVSDAGFSQGAPINQTYDSIVFKDALYIGTSHSEVFRTINGTTWELVNTSGFGYSDNEYAVFGILGDYIYAGAGSVPAPEPGQPQTAEIYRYGVPTPAPAAPEVLPQTGAD